MKIGDLVRIKRNDFPNQYIYSDMTGKISFIDESFCRIFLDDKSSRRLTIIGSSWSISPYINIELLEKIGGNAILSTE